jgi:beta-glucosidase
MVRIYNPAMRIAPVATYVCVLAIITGCGPSKPPGPTSRRVVDLSANPKEGGYLDLNKNGRMDPYENPKLAIDQRVENLLAQMNVEEKTCQMATLYGYPRVLKDDLPTDEWKREIWKTA